MAVGETFLGLLVTGVMLLTATRPSHAFRTAKKCVELDVTQCKDLNQTSTLMPNHRMNIDTMTEASRRIEEFSPLFKIDCYENLKFFICNMFMPVCDVVDDRPLVVYPCRHVCEDAKNGCEPLMTKYNFQWPQVLRCDELKDSRTDPRALCGRPPPPQPSPVVPTVPNVPDRRIPYWLDVLTRFPKTSSWIPDLHKDSNWKIIARKFSFHGDTKIADRAKQVCSRNPNLVYVKQEDKDFCPQRCDANTLFTDTNKKFATVWISTWSVICFLSTLLTVSTFAIDHKRFKYPERPIIFLSFCYNMYSIGYLVRVFSGYDRVICESSSQGKHVVLEGMTVTSCTLVFFILYFFGMAAALWWVVLSLTWFLSAALKWGHEAIEKYSSLFHAISWAIPTIQTIIALVMRKVDVDRLAGICFVGNERSGDLLLFVVLPLMVYLLLGTLFLIMGFVALIKIRKVLKRQRNTNKFERLMIRIGIFSVLYSLPASIVVGCFMQEYNRLKLAEKRAADLIDCLTDYSCAATFQPRVELMYLRYFMLLVVGVTSGVWIWTSKTLNSWKKFTRGGRSGRETDDQTSVYKRQLLAQNASRTGVNRYESGDNASVNTNVMPTLITGGQYGGHPMYPAPTRFFYPVVPKPGGFIQQHGVTSQNEGELTEADNDNGSVFMPKSDDVVSSSHSSKTYSGSRIPDGAPGSHRNTSDSLTRQ